MIKKIHILKCWPCYFAATLAGAKPFEVRIDDRGFKVGHHILEREWDPQTKKYTGRTISFKISCILRDSPMLQKGFCVIGLKKDRSNVWRLYNKEFRNRCRKANYKKSRPAVREHKPWTEYEIDVITGSDRLSDAILAKKLNRSAQSIQQKRYKVTKQK